MTGQKPNKRGDGNRNLEALPLSSKSLLMHTEAWEWQEQNNHVSFICTPCSTTEYKKLVLLCFDLFPIKGMRPSAHVPYLALQLF
jgi:hypothetical protein